MMTPEDLTRLVSEIRRLAGKHPTAVYTPVMVDDDAFIRASSCRYAEGEAAGEVGCIVGQAARNIGLNDGEGFDMYDDESLSADQAILRELDIADVGNDQVIADSRWTDRVQQWQDYGYSWAAAIEYANQMLVS